MDNILTSLKSVKSVWELLYHFSADVNFFTDTINTIDTINVDWDFVFQELTPLFRKDTLHHIISTKHYYPQETPNCRFYKKPNDGSCGKNIEIFNSKPESSIGYTICPEILCPCVYDDNNVPHKYDYRIWVGISSNGKYFVCPTLIKRISNVPFSRDVSYGSLTNTALYSDQYDEINQNVSTKAACIISDVLNTLNTLNSSDVTDKTKLEKNNNIAVTLTGWDFIEDQNKNLFLLEVNCNPSVNILHKQVMTEFLTWVIEFIKN